MTTTHLPPTTLDGYTLNNFGLRLFPTIGLEWEGKFVPNNWLVCPGNISKLPAIKNAGGGPGIMRGGRQGRPGRDVNDQIMGRRETGAGYNINRPHIPPSLLYLVPVLARLHSPIIRLFQTKYGGWNH